MNVPACSHPDDGLIEVTEAERAAGGLSEAHHRQAALLLHTRGYAILRGAIPLPLAQQAEAEFTEVYADCVASKDGDGWYQEAKETAAIFWERNFRWRIFPKLRGALASDWLLANPLVLPLLESGLGEGYYCKFISSDTCLQGAEIQSPHRELGAGLRWEPRAYVVNVPLCRCGLDNGPLEIWYGGSHLWRADVLERLGFHDDVQDGRNAEAEDLAKLFPSRRVELELGDVLIRDPAMLHRGTVNQTERPRSMLTVCYFRAGETHDYGELRYSLDRDQWEEMAEPMRALFAHAFAEPEPVPVGSAPPGTVVKKSRSFWSKLMSW